MNTTEIIDKLKEDGWKEFPDLFNFKHDKTCLAKSFEGHEQCQCNYPKNKQVEIYKYGLFNGWEGSWEVHCVGELPDGQWVDLMVYSLPAETTTIVHLLSKVKELLKTWDFMVRNNKDYTPDRFKDRE